MNIKNKDSLLADLVQGMAEHTHARPADLGVYFHVGDEKYEFNIVKALESLSEDLYWDERGNWANATKAEVFVY